MDELDREILRLLQKNARMTIKDIAKQISLTAPAVSGRIRRMEDKGVIAGYTVKTRTDYDENQINALLSISVPVGNRNEFRALLNKLSGVTSCYHVTGAYSYSMTVRCEDIAQLEHLLMMLQQVGQTSTQIILAEIPIPGGF